MTNRQTGLVGFLNLWCMYVCTRLPTVPALIVLGINQGCRTISLFPFLCTAELSLNSHQFCITHVLLANLFVLSTSNKSVDLYNTFIQFIMQNSTIINNTVFNHQKYAKKKKKGFWDMQSIFHDLSKFWYLWLIISHHRTNDLRFCCPTDQIIRN